ncbi:unnamed protein product [Diamesa serratosioi]
MEGGTRRTDDSSHHRMNYNSISQIPVGYPHRPHSINFFSEDFIAGYQHDNRMSVVRRFFCLFVTFDLVFISLLWIICVVINGGNIYDAFREQVINYKITTSLFDIVAAAALRFFVLIFFYAIIYINHWIVIALTTTASCAFLISKVFIYTWPAAQQPVFQVLLIIISFILSWGEAWFLDCRVIPQERYANFVAINAPNDARTPLFQPYYDSMPSNGFLPPESFHNFYSPFDSAVNSDDEDDDFKQLGNDSVQQAYVLLESTEWKDEKITSQNDKIQSGVKSVGKVYKLTAKVNYSPKKLMQELYYRIEDVPKWNPTLLESKIIRKIDSHTDIAYSVSVSGGGGLIKSRDFVNLRCWQLCNDGKIIENYDLNGSLGATVVDNSSEDGDDEKDNSSDDGNVKIVNEKLLKKSASDVKINITSESQNNGLNQLSKSLGATDLNYGSEEDEPYSDAQTEIISKLNTSKNVFVSAAVSIEYQSCPQTSKYIRGQNIISCWAMREVEDDPMSCIFEWILCIDLKGSIPKYVLNSAYVTLMTDYMTHLRAYIEILNDKDKK